MPRYRVWDCKDCNAEDHIGGMKCPICHSTDMVEREVTASSAPTGLSFLEQARRTTAEWLEVNARTAEGTQQPRMPRIHDDYYINFPPPRAVSDVDTTDEIPF